MAKKHTNMTPKKHLYATAIAMLMIAPACQKQDVDTPKPEIAYVHCSGGKALSFTSFASLTKSAKVIIFEGNIDCGGIFNAKDLLGSLDYEKKLFTDAGKIVLFCDLKVFSAFVTNKEDAEAYYTLCKLGVDMRYPEDPFGLLDPKLIHEAQQWAKYATKTYYHNDWNYGSKNNGR